jgi:hypothetical protein
MRPFRRPTLAVILGWVAAALVATVAGLGGIRLVGDSLTGTPGGVLTEADVQRALGAEPSPSVPADASSSARPLTSPLARPSGSAAVRPGAAPATRTATGKATSAPPTGRGGPAAPPPTAKPTPNRTTPPAVRPGPARTATSKMGNAPATTKAPARGVEATFSTGGGTAIARCTGGQAYLLSWSPRPGYRVDRAKQGPDDEVEVRFEGDEGRSELKISCRNGTPVAEIRDDG